MFAESAVGQAWSVSDVEEALLVAVEFQLVSAPPVLAVGVAEAVVELVGSPPAELLAERSAGELVSAAVAEPWVLPEMAAATRVYYAVVELELDSSLTESELA